MSGVKVSSIEKATVFVRLLDEGVDVWRPVPAERISSVMYTLAAAPPPLDERWSFGPGETIVAEVRDHGAGPMLVAVARASAVDAPSLARSAAG